MDSHSASATAACLVTEYGAARLGQQAGGRRGGQQVAAAALEHAGHDARAPRTRGPCTLTSQTRCHVSSGASMPPSRGCRRWSRTGRSDRLGPRCGRRRASIVGLVRDVGGRGPRPAADRRRRPPRRRRRRGRPRRAPAPSAANRGPGRRPMPLAPPVTTQTGHGAPCRASYDRVTAPATTVPSCPPASRSADRRDAGHRRRARPDGGLGRRAPVGPTAAA